MDCFEPNILRHISHPFLGDLQELDHRSPSCLLAFRWNQITKDIMSDTRKGKGDNCSFPLTCCQATVEAKHTFFNHYYCSFSRLLSQGYNFHCILATPSASDTGMLTAFYCCHALGLIPCLYFCKMPLLLSFSPFNVLIFCIYWNLKRYKDKKLG